MKQGTLKGFTQFDANAEDARKANAHVHTPTTYGPTIRPRTPQRKTVQGQWERHCVAWERYIRKYTRLIEPDDAIRTDIRLWEAKVSGIEVQCNEYRCVSNCMWFMGLHDFNRMEVFRLWRTDRHHSRPPKR